MFELHDLVNNWFVLEEDRSAACGNRFVTWYFCLGELLSPKRKHQETHLCCCVKSRLGELESPERETISSRRTSLAWARVCPGFQFLPLLVSRLGETGSPERDDLSPRLDFLAWARATTVVSNSVFISGNVCFNESLCNLGPVWLECYHWYIVWLNWMNTNYEKMRLWWRIDPNQWWR